MFLPIVRTPLQDRLLCSYLIVMEPFAGFLLKTKRWGIHFYILVQFAVALINISASMIMSENNATDYQLGIWKRKCLTVIEQHSSLTVTVNNEG